MDAPAASAPSMDAPAASAPSMDAPAAAPTPVSIGMIKSNANLKHSTSWGVIAVVPNDLKATLNNAAAYLKAKNITGPYNHVTIFNDGGLRLYDFPPGTNLETDNNPDAKTFYVPGGISVSTFGSMSHFGKSGLSMTMILVILLILGGGYYLHTQGKLKMPTFSQRMAEFGRTIKSLRKM